MFEQCLYFNTLKFSRQINSFWEDAYRPLGLSPSHAYALQFILQQHGITPKKLAANMDLKLSTVTRFIDKLCYQGLVERRKENKDKRECSIYPTKTGQELKTALESIAHDLHNNIRDILGIDNVNDVLPLIRNFNNKMKTKSE